MASSSEKKIANTPCYTTINRLSGTKLPQEPFNAGIIFQSKFATITRRKKDINTNTLRPCSHQMHAYLQVKETMGRHSVSFVFKEKKFPWHRTTVTNLHQTRDWFVHLKKSSGRKIKKVSYKNSTVNLECAERSWRARESLFRIKLGVRRITTVLGWNIFLDYNVNVWDFGK